MVVTTNATARTVRLRSQDTDRYGTGFVVDIAESRVLVTADHVTSGEKDEAFEIVHSLGQRPEDTFQILRRAGQSVAGHDLAVFELPADLLPELDAFHIQLGGSIPLGGDCAILGFPYASELSKFEVDGELRALPIVMRGSIAGSHRTPDGIWPILDLDARPGFSGGPVITTSDSGDSNIVLGFTRGRFMVPDLNNAGARNSEHLVPSGLTLIEGIPALFATLGLPMAMSA